MKMWNSRGAVALATVCGLAVGASASTPVSTGGGDDVITLQPREKRVLPVELDSGPIVVSETAVTGRVLAYSTQVSAPADASWVRLEFGDVVLPGTLGSGDAAYIVITSAADGAHQVLDAKSIGEWASTSAYFNGNTVFIDVYASANTAPARLRVANVRASKPGVGSGHDVVSGGGDPVGRSQCGPWDERTPVSDLRTARLEPIGCTGWTFNNRPNAMGTAGHCNPRAGDVMSFDPPLSTSSGQWQFPPPSNQFAVDGSSIRRVNGGVGNDWAVYGVFNNSTTGLNVMDFAMDSQPTVTDTAPAVSGQNIRITGFGSNSTPDPVPNEWDLAQKTHAGPYVQNSGTALRYAPDTSGGNSGSPVVDDSTGRIIGVHTHAGCSTTGGSNQGTSIANNNWRNALSGAQGIAQGIGPGVMWTPGGAEGRPTRLGPTGGQTVTVGIDADFIGAAPQANSLRMMFDDGNGFVEIAPDGPAGDNLFTFTFPGGSCDDTARYYFRALDASGSAFTWPLGAPAIAFEAEVNGEDVLFAFDGEDDAGFTVSGTATAGDWERGVPSTAGKGAPFLDADGSGSAWMTGEANQFDDVDGGLTRLISPVLDISGAAEPVLEFSYHHYASGNQDQFRVQLNDAQGWVTAFTANNSKGWTRVELPIADFVDVNANFRVRFVSEDQGGSSVVESAVDAVRVIDRACAAGCSPADIAAPFGFLDLADADAFIGAFGDASAVADIAEPFGIVDLADVDMFIGAFSVGCP